MRLQIWSLAWILAAGFIVLILIVWTPPAGMFGVYFILGICFLAAFSGVVLFRSVSRLRQSALVARQWECKVRAIGESSLDAIIIFDSGGLIVFWNPAAERLFQYRESEIFGRPFWGRLESDLCREAWTRLGAISPVEFVGVRRDGTTFPAEVLHSRVLFDDEAHEVCFVRDITERKKVERQLRLLATTDSLTGLSNRRHFLELMSMELVRTIRFGKQMSVIMFDIDFFKRVNDRYGHDVGDKVLQSLSSLIPDLLREVDVVGRLGGEEFAAFLPETDSAGALFVAERLRSGVEAFLVPAGENVITFTISLGVTTVSGGRVEEILKQADVALYHAKKRGRNQVSAFWDLEQ